MLSELVPIDISTLVPSKMAAALFSQSCSTASNLYTTAIISLNTTFPSSPSNPTFSIYATQIFNTPLPFTSAVFFENLPVLNAWQIANVVLFVVTVGVLSWMLDSHHDSDIPSTPSITSNPVNIIPTKDSSKSPTSKCLSQIRHRRRKTLETIATLINLEDTQKRRLTEPFTCSISATPTKAPSQKSAAISKAQSLGIEGTDVHLIIPTFGESISLLHEIDEGLRKVEEKERRRSLQENLIKSQLKEVERYDAGIRWNVEEAERRRRRGNWKTGLLLGLRVPIGWTMK